LNAEKNWHQNNGAKRQDSIKGLDLSAMRVSHHFPKKPAPF
jgi:hypothetical protein